MLQMEASKNSNLEFNSELLFDQSDSFEILIDSLFDQSQAEVQNPEASPSLDPIRYNCPGNNKTLYLKGYSKKSELLEPLATEAEKQGLRKMAFRLRGCLGDAVLLRKKEELKAIPILCGHKLCPVCHEVQAKSIRRRLLEVAKPGQLFVTLTWPTHEDRFLEEYIDKGKQAFRKLTNPKGRPDQFLPLKNGYFWRLELTPGKGFHPHFHAIVDAPWIDQRALQARWSKCLGTKGFVWVSRIEDLHDQRDTCREVAKYLSKDLTEFEPKRWWFLERNLEKKRTFGSGGTLRLPPARKSQGYEILGFASDFTGDYNSVSKRGATEDDLLECCSEGLLDKLRPGSYVRRKLEKKYSG